MSDFSKMTEKAFDILLKEGVNIACEQEGLSYKDPEEKIVFSKEHNQKMAKIFKTEKRKLWRKKALKYSKYAACFLAIITVLSAVTIYNVEALRVKFLNFVFTNDYEGTTFNFEEKQGEQETSIKNNTDIAFGYVPEGFELIDARQKKENIHIRYAFGENYFQILRGDLNGNYSVDTENGTYENIKIDGLEAVYFTNPNINSVVWNDSYYIYIITSNISKEELIKIAENIKK